MANEGQPRTPKVSGLAFDLPKSVHFCTQTKCKSHMFWDWGYNGPTFDRMRKHKVDGLFCNILSWDGIQWGVCEWEDPRVFILGTTIETKSWASECDKDSFVAYKLHHVQRPPLEWKWKLFSMIPHPYCCSSVIIHHTMCLSLCGVITHMHVKNAHPLLNLSSFHLYRYTLLLGPSKLIMCVISHAFHIILME